MPKPHLKPALGLLAVATLALSATPAQAYMGAGAGLSALGSILSFAGVFLLMAVGFVWYPVKRAIKKMRSKKAENDGQAQS